MKRTMLIAAAVWGACAGSAANAATDAEIAKCRNVRDSLARLTCYDNITLENKVAAPVPAGNSSPVVLESAEMRIQQKDYKKSVYGPRVELVPTFKNNSSKTVVALNHTLTIRDAFGDVIVENSDKLDIRIAPGKSVRSEMYYFWDDNPYIQGEPFDRLSGPVTTGTAKASSVVTSVVYADGTIERY